MLSIIAPGTASAASVCVDRRVAITIGEISQQSAQLLTRGDRAGSASYKQMADQLVKAHCIRVDSYPPARTYTKIRMGCQVFTGDARLASGQLTTVYWSLCP